MSNDVGLINAYYRQEEEILSLKAQISELEWDLAHVINNSATIAANQAAYMMDLQNRLQSQLLEMEGRN